MRSSGHGAHTLIRSRTDQKILDAVQEILRESGVGGVTMESISARSGVAKTTLYRRYSNRVDLLMAVIAHLSPLAEGSPLLDEPVTRGSLIVVLREIQDAYERLIGISTVGQILSATGDGTMELWRERVFVPRFEMLRNYCERGVEEGALSPDVDYEFITEMIIGGMIMRDGIAGDVPDEWAEDIVECLWPLIGKR